MTPRSTLIEQASKLVPEFMAKYPNLLSVRPIPPIKMSHQVSAAKMGMTPEEWNKRTVKMRQDRERHRAFMLGITVEEFRKQNNNKTKDV